MTKGIIITIVVAMMPTLVLHSQNTLSISELLYEPRSGEAEYVELYNNSGTPLNLEDFSLIRWIGDSLGRKYPLPSFTLESNRYVVLTKDANSIRANYNVRYPDHIIECDMPPFPNNGGSVIIATDDTTIVDRFDYLPSMHNPLVRNRVGVALERHSFSDPTNAAANWFSASSQVGYGTPTDRNSQSDETIAMDADFILSAPTLSPDGDEYQDNVEITYILSLPGLMFSVNVFNTAGRMVRHIANNAVAGTSGSIVWDGRNDDGTTMPFGRYIIDIEIYNNAGTKQHIRRTVAIRRR